MQEEIDPTTMVMTKPCVIASPRVPGVGSRRTRVRRESTARFVCPKNDGAPWQDANGRWYVRGRNGAVRRVAMLGREEGA